MPGRDRSGPLGRGPASGWGMGPCRGNDSYGYGRRGNRMGFAAGRRGRRGCGMGFGPGFGPGFGYGAVDGRSDREILEEERGWLEERLQAIAKQLEEE